MEMKVGKGERGSGSSENRKEQQVENISAKCFNLVLLYILCGLLAS